MTDYPSAPDDRDEYEVVYDGIAQTFDLLGYVDPDTGIGDEFIHLGDLVYQIAHQGGVDLDGGRLVVAWT